MKINATLYRWYLFWFKYSKYQVVNAARIELDKRKERAAAERYNQRYNAMEHATDEELRRISGDT